VYVVSGMMAGIAAIVLTAWVSAAQPLAGEGLELQSLAAVVIGGVALAGGSGTMPQAFYGALILGLLSNALNMAGVSSFLQTLAIGIVILIAVVVDRLRVRHG
jgi:ribose transport system permease protein